MRTQPRDGVCSAHPDDEENTTDSGTTLADILTKTIVWTPHFEHVSKLQLASHPTSPILCGDYPIHVVGHVSFFTLEFGMMCKAFLQQYQTITFQSTLVIGAVNHSQHDARNINEQVSTGLIYPGIKSTCRKNLCGLCLATVARKSLIAMASYCLFRETCNAS